MLHDWLKIWGEAIEPEDLSGSMAIRFRDFPANEAEGFATITGARRSGSNAEGELLIIQVRTNRPQRPAYPLRREEPVGILFTTDGSFAPSVLALRPDFPDTPHQNWVPEGIPSSLCVDDRPWQEARPLYTPAELLHRIIKWFERAGRGGLHDLSQPPDPFFMREGYHLIIPRNAFDGGTKELIAFTHDPQNPVVVTLREPRPHELQQLQTGTFMVIALALEPRAMSRMRRAPGNLHSLMQELTARGVDLAEVLKARISAWSTAGNHTNFETRIGLLLRMPIIGADGNPTSESDDVAFLTVATLGEIGVALGLLGRSPEGHGARYARLFAPAELDEQALAGMIVLVTAGHLEFDQRRALDLAGSFIDAPRRIVQIGAGAIGSMVADTLARQGFGLHWTFIDPDYLLPHNLARHELTITDIGMPKAQSLARRLTQLRTDLRADAIIANVLKPGDRADDVATVLQAADLVIDAAASVPVARWLSDQTTSARRTSVFFNPAGTAVVMLMEGQDRAIDLRHLEASYYGDVLNVPELDDHLSQSVDAVPYAGACRAVTNRIPAARAQILAGLASAAVMEAVGKPESDLQVWSLSKEGSVAVHQGHVGDVRTQPILGWTITLPSSLEAKILKMRTAGLPAETGGVLFGVVDLVVSRIDIIDAWPAPPDSAASGTEFKRGTKGLRQGVEAAIAQTLDQVRYVGEWHSHPRRARTDPSGKDLLQLGWLAATLSMDGCPGVMLIAGDAGIRICLGATVDDEGDST
ncbi:ThiF family adenylyltransferase [Bradyrhizobium sp. KB893862 SZCCT0404]|uniref:ThiF family adenylyltransferase n=1 Tax=Bradyrhizobium sp. KB893862 SZCCT0404 TaxID=2807672 RepID=UPI001BAA538A|nr:ThiF family adenylyltransferase [Bradyrhizobium sp. KB893862 SZCCT0404]MBR1175384.1 ThiF family adenylyltransferase [Bradyrhizobium sp. KB893862 SZCCT0404]